MSSLPLENSRFVPAQRNDGGNAHLISQDISSQMISNACQNPSKSFVQRPAMQANDLDFLTNDPYGKPHAGQSAFKPFEALDLPGQKTDSVHGRSAFTPFEALDLDVKQKDTGGKSQRKHGQDTAPPPHGQSVFLTFEALDLDLRKDSHKR